VKVTLSAIRDELGGGSPNTLLLHLKAWRAEQAAALMDADMDLDLGDEPAVKPTPMPAHSGDCERSNRLIMNTRSGDHEHRLADAGAGVCECSAVRVDRCY
jgi:hypothetical protein